jgi:hypothetical protein
MQSSFGSGSERLDADSSRQFRQESTGPGIEIAHPAWNEAFAGKRQRACARRHRVRRLINAMSLTASLLGDLRIVLVKFNPDKIAPELQSHLPDRGRTTKGIEHDASPDRWQIGLPSHSHGLSGNVLSAGVLTTRFDSRFFLGL